MAADRYQEIAAKKCIHLGHREQPFGSVESVEQDKGVAGIIIDLWDLVFVNTVFDGQWMKSERFDQQGEILFLGLVVVQPDIAATFHDLQRIIQAGSLCQGTIFGNVIKTCLCHALLRFLQVIGKTLKSIAWFGTLPGPGAFFCFIWKISSALMARSAYSPRPTRSSRPPPLRSGRDYACYVFHRKVEWYSKRAGW